MDDIKITNYTIIANSIDLKTDQSKQNVVIVDSTQHETYDLIQSLYASCIYKPSFEFEPRSITVKIGDLNKVSCDVTDGVLTYSSFVKLDDFDQDAIIDALKEAVENSITSLLSEKQFLSANKDASNKYTKMFKKPLIWCS